MFNKIRKALTGYKVKKVNLSGVPVRISYRGKFGKVDPLSPLKDLKFKLNDNLESKQIDMDIETAWNLKTQLIGNLRPTSKAKFILENHSYTIQRFVTKIDKIPISLYSFSEDDNEFAIFSRLYDYGQQFEDLNLEIENKVGYTKENNPRVHLLGNEQYSKLLDVFGHTQSFIWKNQEKLNKCLKMVN